MIKFEHSVFALPFALTGAMLAWRDAGFPTDHLAWRIFWIVVAMVGARSAAMAFNRILDARYRRRATRAPKCGIFRPDCSARTFAWGFVAFARAAVPHRRPHVEPALFPSSRRSRSAIVFFYSFTKRFTAFSHLVLGFALGIAPAAAWIAMRGSLDPRILWLTAAVTFWTAGFDIIYSCQDYEFDLREGLFSLPRRFGIRGALWIARGLHVADDRLPVLPGLPSSTSARWPWPESAAIVLPADL